MRIRIHSAIVLPALFGLILLGGCGVEESVSDGGNINGDSTTDANGDNGGGEVDLATIDLKKAVEAQMGEAAAAGKYGCCLKMPCSQCLVNMGECPCGGNAQIGEPVCHECKGGWAAGDGAFEDLTADEINVMPRGGEGM
ncbi:MAG: hypothetical protein IH851_06230 [Armatimonadetes bacterium]|nr:hypothetical protein [Armatimonadota bacterium]